MVWTIAKPDCKRLNKDTRWDRIRKKNATTAGMKSSAVKKLVEMDFIGKDNIKLLNGEIDIQRNLNPALVMDLRHEMFQKSKSKPPPSQEKYKPNTGKCIVHNIEIEEHYILNKLSTLKSQLTKNRESITVKSRLLNTDVLKIDNKGILQSLENTSRHVQDCYTCPVKAIEYVAKAGTGDRTEPVEKIDETLSIDAKIADNHDHIAISPRKSESNLAEKPQVTFDDFVQYKREHSTCSESSYSAESAISNLAEEAVGQATTRSESESSIVVEGSSLHKEECNPLVVTKMLNQLRDANDSTTTSSSSDEDSDSSASNEQNAIIDRLFQTENRPNLFVLKKYFMKWIHFTTIQKIERENITNKSDRIHKINAFLDQIRLKKKKQVTQPIEPSSRQLAQTRIQANTNVRKYQSKIKLQQDIIDLQKMKLDRQERLITELKLSKLSDEAKECRQNIKTELKNVFRTGDYKVRATAKCLQVLGNLRDEEDDEFVRLQGKSIMQPKFLLNMQERALMRSVKHEQAKQRRLQKDAEREAARLALEEAKRLEDEEAKKMRIEQLKEKRRLEKLAKIAKERDHQRALENKKKSHDFCRKYLLRRIGMEGFKRLLERKRVNQKNSDAFRARLYQKNVFMAWKNLYLSILQQKNALADCAYERHLKRHAIRTWYDYLKGERSKYLVAVDWYEIKLNQFVFTHWCGYTKLQKIVEDMKTKQAESHYEWHLKWKVLDRWQRLPQMLKLEKETDERRQRWRMKIWELLPDYTPNREGESL